MIISLLKQFKVKIGNVKQAQLIKSSSENITISKKADQSFYNQVAQNLNLTISNLQLMK